MNSDEGSNAAAQERLAQGMEPVPLEKADRDVVIRYFVDPHAKHFPDLREEMLAWVDQIIPKLLLNAEPGDELWICQSRFVGPMAGHQGLGIVRNGKVLTYERLKNY